MDRGNRETHGKHEEPGALRMFRFEAGRLSHPSVVAPNGGYGFGVRHLDFHPTQPWVYVSLESQSMLHMFRMAGEGLEAQPAFVRDTLADRAGIKPKQVAGTIHVHPNGRVVYIANRTDYTVDYQGRKVFGGGENTLTSFSLDAATGEPTLLQHADSRCRHHVFRVGADGRLDFVRKYDVDTAPARTQYLDGHSRSRLTSRAGARARLPMPVESAVHAAPGALRFGRCLLGSLNCLRYSRSAFRPPPCAANIRRTASIVSASSGRLSGR